MVFLDEFLPKSFGIGSFQITFYSLFILTGALLALVISEKRVKDKGYNPKDIENLFLVAFPMGLIGARVWYCVFQAHEFHRANFWLSLAACFGFEDGRFVGLSGLAIQGGVLFGVTAGILFLKKYRKHMKVMDVADACAPTILIAQAIGRFGNFFNREVYGKCISVKGWSWLGDWFVRQMQYDGGTGALICDSVEEMAMPLFLIEGLINIGGFFLLAFLLDKVLRKKMVPGVVTFSYFIWYGLVRVVLEPLRNPSFIMSVNDSGVPTSRITAIVFMVIGAVLVGLCYFNEYYLKPRNRHIGHLLESYKVWFNSLSRRTRIIVEAIPVTGWLNAIVYRLSSENYACGVLCVLVGPIFWIIDLVTTIWKDAILVFAQGLKNQPKVENESKGKENE